MIRYDNVSVEIDVNRWSVWITIEDANGLSLGEYVASADSFFTDNSGIYFGTSKEYTERLK